ncbi:MAG: FTR1 family protein [Promethearchaeota archaeon]
MVTLREGVEIALVLGIILGYIAELGAFGLRKYVYLGFAVAVVASLLVSIALNLLGVVFSGLIERLYEGVTSALAAIVLLTAVLWMHKKGPTIRRELEAKVGLAVEKGTADALAILSFVIVVREGVEIALFLQQSIIQTTVAETILGALIGFTGALVVGLIILKTSARVSTRTFFRVTSIILVFIAAGLLAYGIHELQEAAIIPVVVEHLYDVNFIIDENGLVGSILKALFGYNGNPSLIETTVYLLFLTFSLSYLILSNRGKINLEEINLNEGTHELRNKKSDNRK